MLFRSAKVKDVRDLTLSVRRLAETRVVRIRVNPKTATALGNVEKSDVR